MSPTAHVYFADCALVLASLAALSDSVTGRIPNLLTLPVLAAAPLGHALLLGPGALGDSLLGVVCCGAVPLLMLARGGLGGGDLKLFAALGGLLGWSTGLEIQLVAFWLATFYVCVQLTWRGELLQAFRSALRSFHLTRGSTPSTTDVGNMALQRELRLGVAIACATLGVLWLDGLQWAAP